VQRRLATRTAFAKNSHETAPPVADGAPRTRIRSPQARAHATLGDETAAGLRDRWVVSRADSAPPAERSPHAQPNSCAARLHVAPARRRLHRRRR
jgi:hypothetical protein